MASKLLTSDTPPKMVDTLSVFDVPAFESNICNPKTGLVNGIVCRSKPGDGNRFVFYLQTGDAEGTDRTSRKAVLVAQRQCHSKFYLFDVSNTMNDGSGTFAFETFSSKDDPRFVGKFCRYSRLSSQFASKQYIGYSLYQGRHENEALVESVLFKVAGVKTWWQNNHYRIVHLLSVGPPNNNNNDENMAPSVAVVNGGGGGSAVIEDGSTRLENSVKSLLSKKKTLDEVAAPEEGIYVSVTNLMKDKDGTPKPKFGGRANKVSAFENMTLANVGTNNLSMHMVAWKKNDEYNVDFAAPYNAFQAFGFALAQLELSSNYF